jgi:hypothetical protein
VCQLGCPLCSCPECQYVRAQRQDAADRRERREARRRAGAEVSTTRRAFTPSSTRTGVASKPPSNDCARLGAETQ